MCKDKIQTEIIDSKKKYDKKLYRACNYMVEHLEEFEEFKIYESITESVAEVVSKFEINLKQHNNIASQYNFLMGKEISKSDKESAKGSDIIPVIDVSCLDNPKNLSQILAIFHHFINKDEHRKRLKKALLNVDVDKSDEMLDYLINKINAENNGCNSLEQLNDTRRQLKVKLINDFWEKHKSELGDHEAVYRQKIKFFAEELLTNPKMRYAEFGNLSSIFQVWLYIDLCCWSILQFVIQGIIRNKQDKNKLGSIEKLNKKILCLIEGEKKEKSPVKLEGTTEKMMFGISSYYYERDRYLQEIAVLDFIAKSEMKRENPSPEYSLIRFSPKNGKIMWPEILDLFSEGESNKSLKSFKENLLRCYTGIFQFNKIADRNLMPDPITLRAFYKELYIDGTLYNRRQSMTIFHDFLEQKDMGNADFYFIDEKINTGIFREYGIADEFCAKNDLQGNLYYLVCQMLAALNPSDIINKFKKALESISITICEIYIRASNPVESITNVNLEEEKMKSEIKGIIKAQKEHVEEIQYKDIKELMVLCFKLYNIKFPDGEL